MDRDRERADEFDTWLMPFLTVMGRKTRRTWAPLYLRGLLGPGDRKSLQPMAAPLGLSGHDQLQHFIASPAWDDGPLWTELARQADRLINGILWRFRAGSSWRDVPERYGPRTTLYNRFTRWRAAGVWDRLLDAVSRTYNGDIVMIDSSCVQVHQHGAASQKGALPILAWDAPAAA